MSLFTKQSIAIYSKNYKKITQKKSAWEILVYDAISFYCSLRNIMETNTKKLKYHLFFLVLIGKTQEK